jgi:hypothetical protein
VKQRAFLLLIAAALAMPTAHAQQTDAVPQAVAAANRWLALSDAGDGAATWEQAAPSFRAAVSRAAWSDALRQARGPFGAFKSRTLRSSEFRRSLPGAPDGEYVVIRYDSQFERNAHAVETVVPMRDADGSWKVSGYFVK